MTRHFAKVVLPPKASGARITAASLGETLDTAGAFASRDEARRAWLDEQLAQDRETTRAAQRHARERGGGGSA